MYKELENVDFIMYFSKSNGKLHVVDLTDKQQKDGNGCPWYEGAYGNCLIALNNQKITDRLYLYTANVFNQFTHKDLKNIKLLENQAIRIINRCQ